MSEPSLSTAFNSARIAYKEFRRFADGAIPILRSIVHSNLLDYSSSIDRIEERVKDFDSIRDNYVKERGIPRGSIGLDDFLSDTFDLLGIRVVVYRNQDVDAVSKLLLERLPGAVQEEHLTERDVSRGARFGYRAVHLNFALDASQLLLPIQQKLKCEVQVRTILSDAWSRHSHRFVYKRKEAIPEKLIRTFGATAALLENVDDQINAIEFGATEAERLPPSVELSRLQGFEVFQSESGLNIREEELRALLLEFSSHEQSEADSGASEHFYTTLVHAWRAYGHIDFAKYGISEAIQQVRVALFGFDRSRYVWVLPLHARARIEQVLNVYGRR
jgi:ppGpp synthetase/RelA/SpoT-type nucleotidyltranferase